MTSENDYVSFLRKRESRMEEIGFRVKPSLNGPGVLFPGSERERGVIHPCQIDVFIGNE